MTGEGRRYMSYLLRLWQTESDDGLVWRASLESPQTGERVGFPSLADLVTHLGREMRDHERGEALVPDGPER